MEKDRSDIFKELAKVKGKPSPLKIALEDRPLDPNDESEGQLTIDVWKDPIKDELVVQSTVAGVNPENLEINITNEAVTIRGKREKFEKVEEKDYFYQECFWGSFSRSIILPEEVDPERAIATLKNGVLTIRLPKLDRKRAKKLKVKMDS